MSELEETKEKIIDYILDNHQIGKMTGYKIEIDGNLLTNKEFMQEYLSGPSLKEMDAIDILILPESKKKEALGGVFRDLKQEVARERSERQEASRLNFENTGLPDSKVNRAAYVPVLDVKRAAHILVDLRTRKISEMDFKAWELGLSKEDREYRLGDTRDALLEYDPYDLSSFVLTKFEAGEILKVNTYVPPEWRTRPAPASMKCPELMERLLNHLFPDETAKKYILNWLYNSLVNRNETYLVLNGAKGIGKGIFCTAISALVGFDHYTEAPDSVLNTHFNASLDKKRVVVFDEFKVGKEEHTKLKRFINKFVNIEKKGFDADKAVETYNSYIITNNDESDMHLEGDDRRFSVMDMSDIPLKQVMSPDEMNKLVKLCEDDEEFAYEFGYYIYLHGKQEGLNSHSIYRGAKFSRLVYQTLTEWQKFTIDTVFSRSSEIYYIDDLSKAFKRKTHKGVRFPYSNKKIEDFLKNFLDQTDNRIGYLELEGERHIVPSERYAPSKNVDLL